MIHSTKRDEYWSFWYQEWSNHQNQDNFWWNEAVEVIEAIKVVEAVEVIEAAEVLRSEKSLFRPPKSFRVLNLAFFWWNEAVKVIEATKVVEAVEVIKATEVSDAREITQ